MTLRHISPRSIDWMDAMDEGAGGRGWERLAPEEQEKLLRDRHMTGASARSAAKSARSRVGPEQQQPQPGQGFEFASPSR
jgi:hypothetical protein